MKNKITRQSILDSITENVYYPGFWYYITRRQLAFHSDGIETKEQFAARLFKSFERN